MAQGTQPASRPEIVEAFLEDGGNSYAELAARVEAFLARAEEGRSWAALDVAEFVRAEAATRAERIHLCCNLSALLSMVVDTEMLSRRDAVRLWRELRRVCPNNPAAHRYLELGASVFANDDSN